MGWILAGFLYILGIAPFRELMRKHEDTEADGSHPREAVIASVAMAIMWPIAMCAAGIACLVDSVIGYIRTKKRGKPNA